MKKLATLMAVVTTALFALISPAYAIEVTGTAICNDFGQGPGSFGCRVVNMGVLGETVTDGSLLVDVAIADGKSIELIDTDQDGETIAVAIQVANNSDTDIAFVNMDIELTDENGDVIPSFGQFTTYTAQIPADFPTGYSYDIFAWTVPLHIENISPIVYHGLRINIHVTSGSVTFGNFGQANIFPLHLDSNVGTDGGNGGPILADACPVIVTSNNQTVELTQDLYFPGGEQAACIRVLEADNTIVRLNGFSVNGNGGNLDNFASPTGILVLNSNNVIVQGPGTVTNFARGVGVFGSKNVGIDGLEINDNSRGIYISRSSATNNVSNDVTVANTKVDNSRNRDDSELGGQGILVAGPSREPGQVLQNVHLDNVEVENSEDIGIEFIRFSGDGEDGGRFLVERCKVKNNSRGIGLRSGSDITIRLCEVTDNEDEGIIVGGGFNNAQVEDVKIRDSVITNNGFGLKIAGYYSVLGDVRLRSTCFAGNASGNILNFAYPSVGIVQLDNQFDPPGDCVAAIGLIGILIDTVIAQDFIHGVENSLLDNLNTALNKLEDENPANDGVAINNIGDFIDTVEAKRGNQISDAQADELVALAEAVMASLEAA